MLLPWQDLSNEQIIERIVCKIESLKAQSLFPEEMYEDEIEIEAEIKNLIHIMMLIVADDDTISN